jgi:seryl-tRNA synthetase
MHDIRWIREHQSEFLRGLARRGDNPEPVLKTLLELDQKRRETIALVQNWQEMRNRKSKEIGLAKKAGDELRATALMAEVSRLKADITSAGEQVIARIDSDLQGKLLEVPNIPLDDVPDGAASEDNREHHRFGAIRNYAFIPKQHFELGEQLDQMSFEVAAKLSGTRFVVLKRDLARLQRALGQFMLDVHTREHGYEEVAPPLLVRDHTMIGTAQLPKFFEDQFVAYSGPAFVASLENLGNRNLEKIKEIAHQQGPGVLDHLKVTDVGVGYEKDRHWLIPTAEVPLTNLVREQILDEDALPLRFTALTPCFRAEAGAAGKDTRGMLRQHQFDKVELVSITTPEKSLDEHERMLSCAEEILRRLDLHYRVVTLCTGDMGFASQKTYDIEVWLPGQGAYREISSCSVCGEFQARRMDARYRGKSDRSVRHVHTLNGSGVAVGRALIAVMETYQDQGGGIAVPDVLQSYMGGTKRIERATKS